MPEGVQLPQWQSHKKVWADKVTAAAPMHWSLACGGSVNLSMELRNRVPAGVDPVGGFYVRYEDGFESWSPAQAFEDGYTRI